MDPDACLTQLRAAYQRAERTADPAELAQLAAELSEGLLALDGWLSSGGFLPAAWTVGRGYELAPL